jgi:hypothetical protein
MSNEESRPASATTTSSAYLDCRSTLQAEAAVGRLALRGARLDGFVRASWLPGNRRAARHGRHATLLDQSRAKQPHHDKRLAASVPARTGE